EEFDGTGRMVSQGSGVAIEKDKIVTACHVQKGGVKWRITGRGGKTFDGVLGIFDNAHDICIVTGSGGELTPVTIGDSAALRPGDEVIAIGSPLGTLNSPTKGLFQGVQID